MMIALFGIILLLSTTVQSDAQSDQSAYCFSGAGVLSSGTGANLFEKELAQVRQKCRKGDTIVLPSGGAGLAATLCDFTQAIITSSGSIACVLAGERARR